MLIFIVGWMVISVPNARATEPSVSSQSDSNVEKARASFQQGVRLFHEGSYEAAVAEFQKAYRLAPSYRILYNIAQAYGEIHDYVSGIKALKQYLTDGKDDLAANKRSQIEDLIKEFEARIAYLDIQTNVEGAEIRIDGISVGQSPLPYSIPVNAGPRKISAHKTGFSSVVHGVTVAGAEHHNITLDLPGQTASKEKPALAEITTSTPQNSATKLPLRASLIVSLVATGTCALATGMVGYVALRAKKDFETQLDSYPATKDQIDSARSKMSTYAAITDGLGAATVIAGGLSLYFVLTNRTESGSSGTLTSSKSMTLLPTLGGMALYGQW